MTQWTAKPFPHQGRRTNPRWRVEGPKNDNLWTFEKEDALLIAAAPMLLKALEKLVERCKYLDQSVTHDGLQNTEAIMDARMAINEAYKK